MSTSLLSYEGTWPSRKFSIQNAKFAVSTPCVCACSVHSVHSVSQCESVSTGTRGRERCVLVKSRMKALRDAKSASGTINCGGNGYLRTQRSLTRTRTRPY